MMSLIKVMAVQMDNAPHIPSFCSKIFGIDFLIYTSVHTCMCVLWIIYMYICDNSIRNHYCNKLILQYLKTRCCKYYTLYNDTVLQC